MPHDDQRAVRRAFGRGEGDLRAVLEADGPGAQEEEAEHEDFVVADSPMDVRQLVAESVILALPMVPRKPGAEPADDTRARSGEPSPFAALAGLKRSDSE